MASTPPSFSRAVTAAASWPSGLTAGVALYVIGAPIFNDRIETDLERACARRARRGGLRRRASRRSPVRTARCSCDQPLDDPEERRQRRLRRLGRAGDRARPVVPGQPGADASRPARPRHPTRRTPATPPAPPTHGVEVGRPTTATPLAGSAPTARPRHRRRHRGDQPAVSSLLSVLIEQSGFDAALGRLRTVTSPCSLPPTPPSMRSPADVMAEPARRPRSVEARHRPPCRRRSPHLGCALRSARSSRPIGGTLDVVVEPDQIMVGGGIIIGHRHRGRERRRAHDRPGAGARRNRARVGRTNRHRSSATFDVGAITFEGAVASEVERAAFVGAATSVLDAESVIDHLIVDPDVGLDADDHHGARPAGDGDAGQLAQWRQRVRRHRAVHARHVSQRRRPGGDGRGAPERSVPKPRSSRVRDATADDANEPRGRAQRVRRRQPDPLRTELGHARRRRLPASSTRSPVGPSSSASVSITVEGHTDSDGNPSENLTLSRQRALAVRDALVERGLPQASIVAEGFGSQRRSWSAASRTRTPADGSSSGWWHRRDRRAWHDERRHDLPPRPHGRPSAAGRSSAPAAVRLRGALMPYTLAKGFVWVVLAMLLGIVIGWLLRSVVAKRQVGQGPLAPRRHRRAGAVAWPHRQPRTGRRRARSAQGGAGDAPHPHAPDDRTRGRDRLLQRRRRSSRRQLPPRRRRRPTWPVPPRCSVERSHSTTSRWSRASVPRSNSSATGSASGPGSTSPPPRCRCCARCSPTPVRVSAPTTLAPGPSRPICSPTAGGRSFKRLTDELQGGRPVE